jgi:hypothetical protein
MTMLSALRADLTHKMNSFHVTRTKEQTNKQKGKQNNKADFQA